MVYGRLWEDNRTHSALQVQRHRTLLKVVKISKTCFHFVVMGNGLFYEFKIKSTKKSSFKINDH